MNIALHVFFQCIHVFFKVVFSVFAHIPRSGMLSHIVALVLAFEEAARFFPQGMHLFAFLTAVHKSSLFSTSSPVFVTCVLLDGNRSDRHAFPWWLVMWSIFSYICCPFLMYSLEKCLFESSTHFFQLVIWFFAVELYEFFMFGY